VLARRQEPSSWAATVSRDLIIGLLAALAAAACFDGAVILQAAEARTVPDEHGLRLSLLGRLVARRRWVAGTAVAILGWPLQLLAFSRAPVTLVQPALGLGTILLLVAGARVLGERVGRREWVAAGAVIAGVAVLAAVAPDVDDAVPPAGRLALCAAPLAVAATLPFWPLARPPGLWRLVAGAGAAFALSAIGGKLVAVELDAGDPLGALGFGALTAIAAGAGFLVDMTSLQRFEATRASPPMFVLETAIPVAVAPVLFGEGWGSTPGGGVLVLAGLALVLAGGAALGASRVVAAADQLEDDGGGRRPGSVGLVGVTRSGERAADGTDEL